MQLVGGMIVSDATTAPEPVLEQCEKEVTKVQNTADVAMGLVQATTLSDAGCNS